MKPYDYEDDWNWEADTDTMDWPWPTFAAPTQPDHFYDPCPLGCDLGVARYGNNLAFECPACGGSGLGGEHRC
jgi:hypothetical protein